MIPAKLKDIESILAKYPIFQYGFLNSKEIKFSDKVRHICETECERYNQCRSCPPVVGSVETCLAKCMKYQSVLLFSTIAETENPEDMKECLNTRKEHEQIVTWLCSEIEQLPEEYIALSSGSCNECSLCTQSDGSCICGQEMLPSIESYGILVVDAAEKCDMDLYYNYNTLLWFGMIFFHRNCE